MNRTVRRMLILMIASGIAASAIPMPAVANQNPLPPSNPSPVNGQVGTATSPRLTWDASDPDGDALNYEVYVDKESDAHGSPSTLRCQTTVRACELSGLSPATKYQWVVQVRDGRGGFSQNAIAWEFTTMGGSTVNQNPLPPSNPSPVNGQVGTATSPRLTWDASDPDGDALNYEVYVDKESDAHGSPSTLRCQTTVRACELSGLSPATKYQWVVQVRDGRGGFSQNAIAWEFTTIAAPANQGPTACFSASVVGLRVEVDARCSRDPDGGIVTISWEWGDGAGSVGGPLASHSYSCNGDFGIQLTVADEQGSTDSSSQLVSPRDEDNDVDGLPACRERALGTDDNDWDTDDDSLSDLIETRDWSEFEDAYCNNARTACMDPDPLGRDVFIEVDYFNGLEFTLASQTLVENVWRNDQPATNHAPIRLHLDNGDGFDGSTSLGPGGTGYSAWDNRNTKLSNMAAARQSIFHYAVMACSHPSDALFIEGAGTLGEAEAGGDDFALYMCHMRDDPDLAARVFLHEFGHNLAGLQVNVDPELCPSDVRDLFNLDLHHFEHDDGLSADDCTGDGNPDIFAHDTDPGEALTPGAPALGHLDETWRDFKLHYGAGPSKVESCPAGIPVLGPLLTACSPVATHTDRKVS